ncbi:tetratricopeptide repeat protein [Streptomyces tagetis]|uniref:Tetratricopeptide repeat protein n=1 Tax=Streptomyces tagetis TaxID=2820809 RepID=A0A940XP34_9ACTN|nr:tetratricopeptide repeat protein [Streptomyces sp. RG38]MBQ0827228.1 tetratricopeptide repeat protein [Streptomyces sp. RG38]
MSGRAERGAGVAEVGQGGRAKASAAEYQGALGSLSVNAPLPDVLARGLEELRAAEDAGDLRETARCGLAVAEAYRRLGRTEQADRAWKASYRAARAANHAGAMAWALWSGGTLARQRGAFRLAYRLLRLAAEWGERGGDVVVRGYSLAGLAETGRIQGDYAAVEELHEQLLAEARRRGEARHTVWALEGIAQMHRNTGDFGRALALFEEAAEIAERAEDRRGWAWALRGMADVVSVRDGEVERALSLLSRGEEACRSMNLRGALAFNHKMRGNVLYRAGRYEEARGWYARALEEFGDMAEPRGTALSRLGLAKSSSRLGLRGEAETVADLVELWGLLEGIGLRHAREMVEKAAVELGVGPLPRVRAGAGAAGLSRSRAQALAVADVAGLR